MTHPAADPLRAALERAAALGLEFHDRRGVGSPYASASVAELHSALDGPLPEDGEIPTEVIEHLARGVAPGLVGSAGPDFFGWVIGGSHPAGVAADWLTSVWGQNAGLHATSPASAVVEHVVADWILDLLDLPRSASVGLVTGATMANFVGLAAARHALLARHDWDVERRGLFGAPELRVVLGEDAHSTVFAALQYLGLGSERVVRVASDRNGAMDPAALATALDDGAAGTPTLVIAQAGQIHSGAIDPMNAVVEIAHRHDAWVHVDGAFGLWARATPKTSPTRALAAGMEGADSWATDGHKWLQTPYDCGLAIVRDAEAHRRAMTIAASYLPPASAGERDPSGTVPELSRRARGFAAWAVIRALGRSGIEEMVERHVRLAKRLADRLRAEEGIEIPHDVTLDQVFVHFGSGDDLETANRLARETIARIQRDAVSFVGGASWRGRWGLRVSIASWWTQDEHIDRAAESILGAWRTVRGAG